jgi:CheY-like chemotaxis protein
MIGPGTRIWQVRELFDEVRQTVFGDVSAEALTMRFPEYLPPLVVDVGVEEAICRAAWAIRECAESGDRFLVSAHYEDDRDPVRCCVVLSVQLQRPGMQDGFVVESGWLEELGKVTEQLLARSVALAVDTVEGRFNFDFRLTVHPAGAQLPIHRDTILLVEDDHFVRGATREVLEMAGHRVVESANAAQALQVFESNRRSINLVISDVTMPGQDGRELAVALHTVMPRMPILLISGYSHPVVEDLAKKLYFLPKPYNPAGLMKAVHRCFRMHHEETMGLLQFVGQAERATGFC